LELDNTGDRIMYKWKVCPIQGRQLRGIHKEDILETLKEEKI